MLAAACVAQHIYVINLTCALINPASADYGLTLAGSESWSGDNRSANSNLVARTDTCAAGISAVSAEEKENSKQQNSHQETKACLITNIAKTTIKPKAKVSLNISLEPSRCAIIAVTSDARVSRKETPKAIVAGK